MPCPTGSFKIISRGKGQSCMASCAYYSGEKKYSEYECCWKYPHSSSSRVKWVEVMLPPNAPKAYADPQTLWNAVDAAETSVNAQTARSMLFALPRELTDEQNLALVRDFCQKEFVDKGMVCNFFHHDKGDGNPHVHIMLTLRAMDENGKWLPKSKNVYALDENGNRIRAPNGSWKRVKVDTVDWNERKYGEIWRQDWAAAQNAALEAAGRMERVDMRSLERQGVEDRLPQKHLGPTASALERKGVSSERGDENRKIISVNKMLAFLQKTVRGIGAWLDELRKAVSCQQIIESPDDYPLSDVITAYLDMRKDGRETWNRYAQEKGAVHDLKAEREALLPKLEEVKAELAELNRIRYWTRKVIPDALPRVSDGRVSVEDAVETAVNRKELEQVEDEATQTAARRPQEQEKQKVKQQEEIVPM